MNNLPTDMTEEQMKMVLAFVKAKEMTEKIARFERRAKRQRESIKKYHGLHKDYKGKYDPKLKGPTGQVGEDPSMDKRFSKKHQIRDFYAKTLK